MMTPKAVLLSAIVLWLLCACAWIGHAIKHARSGNREACLGRVMAASVSIGMAALCAVVLSHG